VSTVVTNTGKVTGKEVVELYVSAPRKTLQKPTQELRAFGKTRLLKPGESETVKFTLSARDLASFDPTVSSWVVEAGNYTVSVGDSAAGPNSSVKMVVPRDLVVEKSQRLLSPAQEVKEIQPK